MLTVVRSGSLLGVELSQLELRLVQCLIRWLPNSLHVLEGSEGLHEMVSSFFRVRRSGVVLKVVLKIFHVVSLGLYVDTFPSALSFLEDPGVFGSDTFLNKPIKLFFRDAKPDAESINPFVTLRVEGVELSEAVVSAVTANDPSSYQGGGTRHETTLGR